MEAVLRRNEPFFGANHFSGGDGVVPGRSMGSSRSEYGPT